MPTGFFFLAPFFFPAPFFPAVFLPAFFIDFFAIQPLLSFERSEDRSLHRPALTDGHFAVRGNRELLGTQTASALPQRDRSSSHRAAATAPRHRVAIAR